MPDNREDLAALSAKATPGPWEAERDTTHEDYAVGRIIAPNCKAHGEPGVIFEGSNSTIAEVHGQSDEDGHYDWDAVSMANAGFIVALVNAYRDGSLVSPTAGGEYGWTGNSVHSVGTGVAVSPTAGGEGVALKTTPEERQAAREAKLLGAQRFMNDIDTLIAEEARLRAALAASGEAREDMASRFARLEEELAASEAARAEAEKRASHNQRLADAYARQLGVNLDGSPRRETIALRPESEAVGGGETMAFQEGYQVLAKEIGEALGYATRLATLLREKHFPDLPQWRPLPDLYGVLTQIDNMTTALSRSAGRSAEVGDAARAGYNACRKSLFAVCEDVDREYEKHRSDTENAPRHHFGRGGISAAKSIARGFASMEAEDDDNFASALSPAPRVAPDDGWRPIETAPKADRTRVQLAWGETVVIGFWLDNSKTSHPWQGWRAEGMLALKGQPTHWRPLPAPPAAAERAGTDAEGGDDE